MYHRYKGPPDGRYTVCTAAAILDTYGTSLSFYFVVSHVFPLAVLFSNAVNTMEGNENS